MKICQLCNLDTTLYHFLLPLMEGMRDAGHEVVGVCAPGDFTKKVEAKGFRVAPFRIRRSHNPVKHLPAIRELTRFFRDEQFDIVHVHNPVAALVGRCAAWRAGVPCIAYTAHGFYFHEHMPLHKRAPFVALEWLAGRVTDVLFTQADEDAETAKRLGLLRNGHIQAIGNGVDPDIFHPKVSTRNREKIRRQIGSAKDRVVILSIGRLVAEKGFPELISAMADLDADLWIVGERLTGEHAEGIDDALERSRRDPRLKGKVHLLGYRLDMPDVIRAADIYASASHREGMPRTIIEAMMCGLPVVATNIRGSREEVVDGKTGRLVTLKDVRALTEALGELVKDKKKRMAWGAAGRKRAVKLYDEAKVVARQIKALGL